MTDETALEAACAAVILGTDKDGNPVHLSPAEADLAIAAYISALTPDVSGLVERLRKVSSTLKEYGWGNVMVDPPKEAADALAFLSSQLVAVEGASVAPAPLTHTVGTGDKIADAIEACDWSGSPIGNKAILKAAAAELRSLRAWQRGALSCREAEEARIDDYRLAAEAATPSPQPSATLSTPSKEGDK